MYKYDENIRHRNAKWVILNLCNIILSKYTRSTDRMNIIIGKRNVRFAQVSVCKYSLFKLVGNAFYVSSGFLVVKV